ncbi:PepSY-associated TM helix domain-containing protein [Litorilituus lipolyticus]|uniref:PepSY domain-containing protein n=1 Tax=Litorilituus lipolyticus TaxID=2491017 RepID=A0A502L6P4_9GAMM|nr:PepSY-associated TM helix domain-containing protein [Litorilituus lipolyticus]TPH18135.1 PepSY domain-containing protein [Litorilituus lipolyticus]
MNIRKIFFWFHLILGCSAALFIFLMSVTGVALTYERQMIQIAEQSDYVTPLTEQQLSLPLAEIVKKVDLLPVKKVASIQLKNNPNAPIVIREGRKTLAYLDPYTGESLSSPGEGTKLFLKKLRAFHRWLTFDGSFSETGRWVNGIANVIFIVLVLSGIYLWLPKRFKIRSFKQKLTLTGNYPSKQARNYQWHNVFGIYVVPVLLVVVITAIFFSFDWPGKVLKDNVSTEMVKLSVPSNSTLSDDQYILSIDEQLAVIKAAYPLWQSMRFNLSNTKTEMNIFHLDEGNGGEPQKRRSIMLNAVTGKVEKEQKFSDMSTYRKARSYIRFLHTGEAFGLIGQTLAGLASLLACFLVYTGVMLSWVRWQNSRGRKAQQ